MKRIRNRQLINLPMILQILGWLLGIEAVFMLVPTFTSIVLKEPDWPIFFGTTIGTGLAGGLCTKYIRPESRHLGRRDGFLLTALVWVIFSLFGMMPFILASPHLNISEAFFEAMSGFTTTGVSTIENPTGLTHGMHLWRALMQWIGGMGIIVFTLAVIPLLNHSGGIQMFNAESTGITHDKIRPRISQTAKTLWGTYLLLTILLVILLFLGPMDFFQSVCHAMGTISTGGYTTDDTVMITYGTSIYIKIILIIFMFLGGVNFALLFRGAHGDFKGLWHNDALKVYVGAIIVMTVMMSLIVLMNGQAHNWKEATIEPMYQVVSTITSTGVPAANFINWGPLAVGLSFCMMFSGGCAGSTSGGAKIDRVIFLGKHFYNEVYRCIYPNSIKSVRINKLVIAPDLVNKVVAFMGLFVGVLGVGGLILAAMGVPVLDAFFSVFSCICNTGFGTEVAGGTVTYSQLPEPALWILCLEMLTGRLEVFTVLVLFLPVFWRK